MDASAATAKYNLGKGRSVLIYVGGEKEQLMSKPHEHKIYLKSRKGFIKLALLHGAHLVPMVRAHQTNSICSQCNLTYLVLCAVLFWRE